MITDDEIEALKASYEQGDIAELLRSSATVFYEYAADNGALLRRAAEEIIRLRARLQHAETERDKAGIAWKVARNVLLKREVNP